MPELPEVEVICRQLRKVICNKKIKSIDVFLPRMIRNTDAKALNYLMGDEWIDVERHGKYILLLSKKGQIVLVHLRMTGRLLYQSPAHMVQEKYERLRFTFSDDTYLTYGDTRTLGAIYYFKNRESINIKGYLALGVEPLSDKFSPEVCYDVTRKSKMPIKTFLLAQKYIAGLGNIYVDEALFATNIHPRRPANSLTKDECNNLYEVIVDLLSNSIVRGGTTFRDYKNSEGESGNNQNYLKAYGRGGQACVVCNKTLATDKIGGRTTVYCEKCQPLEK